MTWNELYLWCGQWCCRLQKSGIPELRELSPSWDEMADTLANLEVRHDSQVEDAVFAMLDGQPLPELEPGAKLMLYERLSWARSLARVLALGVAAGSISESPAETQHPAEWLLIDAWSEEGFESTRGKIAALLSSAPRAKEPFQNN